jgi:hypothetical protein
VEVFSVEDAIAVGAGGEMTVVLLASSPLDELIGAQDTFFLPGREIFLFGSSALFDQRFKLLIRYGVHGAIAFLDRSTDFSLT